MKTTDLCDAHRNELAVVEPLFRDFGGARSFAGKIATVQVFEDNVLVKKFLEEPGNGRVLVVDGSGSLRFALVGGVIAGLAEKNGWAGILIFGCVRDMDEIAQVKIGVKALNVNPMPSKKEGKGQREIPVTFGGVTFTPGHYLYADEDGVVVSVKEL